ADAGAKERYGRMRDEIAALPGVVAVGIGSSMPLRTSIRTEITADGKPLAVGESTPNADFRTADPDYFAAAGIPLIKGRLFSTTDVKGSGKVVIVNQLLADRLFPGEDPIGKRIALAGMLL